MRRLSRASAAIHNKEQFKMNFDAAVLDQLADALAKAGYLSTQSQIEAKVREISAQLQAGKGRFDSGNKDRKSVV